MNLESQNLFAALDTKKKKKTKSSKDHDKKKKQPDKAERAAELDRAVFSQPAPTTTNWADEDEFDEFDQDLGPLPESWAQAHNSHATAAEEDTAESDEEVDQQAIEEALGIELGKDEEEEEEEDQEDEHSDTEEPATTSADDEASKKNATEQQKQLSKKEQKKKELDELNAMLAEMGVAPKEADAEGNGTAPAGKKKKKKDKTANKESAPAVNGHGAAPDEEPAKPAEESTEDTQQEPIEGGFKKVPPKVKKPAAKKTSAAIAAAAAAEAKARASKKGKQKDKSTFNQAPTR